MACAAVLYVRTHLYAVRVFLRTPCTNSSYEYDYSRRAKDTRIQYRTDEKYLHRTEKLKKQEGIS